MHENDREAPTTIKRSNTFEFRGNVGDDHYDNDDDGDDNEWL